MFVKVKRFLSLLLIICLLSLTGCGQKIDVKWRNGIGKDKRIDIQTDASSEITDKTDTDYNNQSVNSKDEKKNNLSDEDDGNSFSSSEKVIRFKSPSAYGMTNTQNPLFSWSNISGAVYTLKIDEYINGNWKNVITENNLKSNSFQSSSLKQGGIYRAFVTANTDKGSFNCLESEYGGLIFMNYINPKDNPSNKGLDYKFKNTISENVLNNYLDRAFTCELITDTQTVLSLEEECRNKIRALLNVGAKYVSRSYGSFNVTSGIFGTNANMIKNVVTDAHKIDSDIIFEAGIFETTSTGVNSIAIPEWVFKAFNQNSEQRNFDCTRMLFSDGSGLNQFGDGLHCPDITKEETQMFYYYLACNYIDMGMEALHLGQTWLVGKNDVNYKCYDSLITKIRSYAKTHARRGLVLINSHNSTVPMKNAQNQFLIDFLAEPAAIYDVSGEPPHLPSDDNPQKAEIRLNSGVWTRKYSGITPSGWHTDNLPCYAEFDNWMSVPADNNLLAVTTNRVDVPWGMDEISWFANQPLSYRNTFISYMYNTVKSFNKNAHVCFPMSRPAYLIKNSKMSFYNASYSVFFSAGFDNEETYKTVFSNGR